MNNIVHDPIVFHQNKISHSSTSGWSELRIINDIPAKPNLSYTFKEDSIDKTASMSQLIISFLDSSKVRIGSLLYVQHTSLEGTFTSPEGTAYLRMNLAVYSGTATYNNFIVYTGDTDQRTLNPDIKLNIPTITENMTSFIDGKLVYRVDELTASNTGYWADSPVVDIQVEPNKTYKLGEYKTEIIASAAGDGVGSVGINFYKNGASIKRLWSGPDGLVFATPSDFDKCTVHTSFGGNTSALKTIKYIGIKIWEGQGTTPYKLSDLIRTDIDYKKYGLPILYLNGDIGNMTKDDAVEMTYEYEGRTGTAEVKWQGSSSLTYPKKNYTVKFDNPFEAKAGWGEQKKYCMKANYIDFSHSRNVVSAKLWGQVLASRTNVPTELETAPNYGAIDGFPICIVINGTYTGLYTFNIPKDAWLFGMGSGTKEAIICAEGTSTGSGFSQNPVVGTDFEVEYATDEDDVTWIQTGLTNIYNAIQSATEDNFEEVVGQYLDIESLIDYIIFIDSINAIDNTIKNYLLATYDGIKWYMSVYDMDSSFGLYWNGKSFVNSHSVNNSTPLGNSNTLYLRAKQCLMSKIKARYKDLKSNYSRPLHKSNVTKQILDFTAGIPKAMFDEEVKIWTELPSTAISNANQMVHHYCERQEYLDIWFENN